MQSETAEKQVARRTFFSYAIAAVGGFIGAAAGIPLIGALVLPTLRQRPANWVTVGAVEDFPVGQPKSTQIAMTRRDGWIQQQESKAVWVIRHGEDSFAVFNGRCTHLGCAFSWQTASNEFVCPCHGGRFSPEGTVLGGPPPRSLDALQWRVEQGNLLVEHQDFRLGVSQKETA